MRVITSTIRLTAEEFQRAVANRRLTEQSKKIGRKVLVDGKDIPAVAKEYGMTRQRIHMIRDQAYAAFLETAMYPPNWTTATVVAPPKMLKDFLEKVEKERRRYVSAKWKS